MTSSEQSVHKFSNSLNRNISGMKSQIRVYVLSLGLIRITSTLMLAKLSKVRETTGEYWFTAKDRAGFPVASNITLSPSVVFLSL